MAYQLMRLRKYYDAFRSNESFLKTSYYHKSKIIKNIFIYSRSIIKKPLILKNKPVIAQIEPTSECNLRCEMCIREKTGIPIGTMKFEDFKKILDKLDSLFKVHLSGQGEPFLNKELFDMINYANKRGITVFFTTNGTLLTKNIIKKICEVDIGEIGISLDSTEKEKYEKIRKGANFQRLNDNIKNLVSELKKKDKKTILSTSAVILKKNINEIPRFVELANSLGVKKVGFQTLQEKEYYLSKYDSDIRIQKVSAYNKEINEKINEAKRLGKKYGLSVIFDEEKINGCIWPWRSLYISWDGYVTACCKILNYKEPLIGNILEEDFWKIWNGEVYQEFRRALRDRKAPVSCRGCSMV